MMDVVPIQIVFSIPRPFHAFLQCLFELQVIVNPAG
jgi:hypothetical protein